MTDSRGGSRSLFPNVGDRQSLTEVQEQRDQSPSRSSISARDRNLIGMGVNPHEYQRQQSSEQREQQQYSETTRQLNQHLGDLFLYGYQNITPRQQQILDCAMEVSAEMTQELNIQTSGFGDQRSVMLGDILQGGARDTTGSYDSIRASLTEDERRSGLYQELKNSFLTRLKDKMTQISDEDSLRQYYQLSDDEDSPRQYYQLSDELAQRLQETGRDFLQQRLRQSGHNSLQ